MKTKFHMIFATIIGISLAGFGNSLFPSPALSREPDCINYMFMQSGSAQCYDENFNVISAPLPVKNTAPKKDISARRRSVLDSNIASICESLSNDLSKSQYESVQSCVGKE